VGNNKSCVQEIFRDFSVRGGRSLTVANPSERICVDASSICESSKMVLPLGWRCSIPRQLILRKCDESLHTFAISPVCCGATIRVGALESESRPLNPGSTNINGAVLGANFEFWLRRVHKRMPGPKSIDRQRHPD
jgi:hypothetical protein